MRSMFRFSGRRQVIILLNTEGPQDSGIPNRKESLTALGQPRCIHHDTLINGFG